MTNTAIIVQIAPIAETTVTSRNVFKINEGINKNIPMMTVHMGLVKAALLKNRGKQKISID